MAETEKDETALEHPRPMSFWMWEIFAATTSLLFLIALVSLLAGFNHLAIFDWHGVTLNAYVSILSTASKASLLYHVEQAIGQWKWILYAYRSRPLLDVERINAASSGPLGSALLLWSCRRISFLRLGAIATILALVLDPFAQQLIQTELRLANTTTWTPTIARSDRYSLGYAERMYGDVHISADTDAFMKVAILSGMTRSFEAITNQTSLSCPTGNCTWTPFESLAVCSRCNDLAGQLTRYSNNTALINILSSDSTFASMTYGTTFRTENGLIINNPDNMTYTLPGRAEVSEIKSTIYMTTFGTGNASATATFKENDLLIWSATILRLREPAQPDQKWPNLPIEATECALSYCVKRYDAKVYNGALTEGSITLQDVRRSPDSWLVDLVRYMSNQNSTVFENNTAAQSLEYSSLAEGLHWSDLMLETDGSQRYNLSQTSVHGISAYLQATLRQPVNLSTFGGVEGVLNGWALDFGGGRAGSGIATQYSTPIMQSLWETSNITAFFHILAHSMSNAIRASDYTIANTNSTSAHHGVAQITVIFYAIQWGWIALHAVLVLGGLLFLCITITETVRLGIPAWKSHALPPLAFPDQVGDLLLDVQSVQVMEDRAAKHYVRLMAGRRDATTPLTHTTLLHGG